MKTQEVQNKLRDEIFYNNALLFALIDNPTDDEKMDIEDETSAFARQYNENKRECITYAEMAEGYTYKELKALKSNNDINAACYFAVANLLSGNNNYSTLIKEIIKTI